MSFSYAYNPIVSNPLVSKHIPQMESDGFQTPFYFGGSQVPHDIGYHESKSKSRHLISTSCEKIGQGIHKQNLYGEKHTNINLPRNLPSIKK